MHVRIEVSMFTSRCVTLPHLSFPVRTRYSTKVPPTIDLERKHKKK